MPCFDGRSGDGRVVYEKGFDPDSKRIIQNQKKRLDSLTDLLCKAGRARSNKTDIPLEVLQWWDDHCKLDKKRGEPW